MIHTVIVTGGASGLGKAIATAFLETGASVVLVDVAGDRVRATAEELGALGHGGAVLAIQADISSATAVDGVVEETEGMFGGVDALVNCAGIMDTFQAVGEQDVALWTRVLAVNLNGPFLMSRAVMPHFEAQRNGVIVNVASIAALRGGMAGTAYTTSKYALVGLTKSTAAAYARSGIRCNAVCPGGMATDMDASMDMGAMGSMLGGVMKTMEQSAGLVDVARLARIVVFLCSDDAQDVNGAVITVDKGLCAI